MSSITTEFPVISEENITTDLLPAVQFCAGMLNIPVTAVGILEIVANPVSVFMDSRAATVRYITERLYHIRTSHQSRFRLDAYTLMQETSRLDWCHENSFFYESVLEQECRYLVPVPLSEMNAFQDLLAPLIFWKSWGFQFRHTASLGVALLLATLARLAMIDTRLRKHIFSLMQIISETSAWQLGPVLYCRIHEIIRLEGKEC
ncbi:hypothetical protein [Victivallis sp. Marseille-Q1083]|uniref:hypothetical protein n=1 Tax=Victivallis sp. Marseille-Q1083 TaxID=2717288 RepID=UPI00158EA10C|nr:hypothetical protein [Victivallis sp. Marseille-Q1083]